MSEGLSTQKCLSPTTNTLCRTAPWLTKLWSTQGGWTTARFAALKITDICADIAQTVNEQTANAQR